MWAKIINYINNSEEPKAFFHLAVGIDGEMEKARKVFGHFASLIYFVFWLVVLAFTF